MGRKIAALGVNQVEISRVLGLTQQSVSGKFTGKIAITVKDMEILSAAFDVPMIYFVSPEIVTAEAARAFMKIMAGPPETLQTMEVAASFDRNFSRQLWGIVQSMRVTASYFESIGTIPAPAEKTKTAEA
jgi:transcriptional regulator with XRE-family HTH domain